MKYGALLVLVFGLGLGGYVLLKKHDEPVWATFDGGQVKAKEVLAVVKVDSSTNAEIERKVRTAATMELVKRQLLEIEARRQNTNADELMDRLSLDLPPTTDEEVQRYLLAQHKDPGQAGTKEVEEIRRLLHSRKILETNARYLDELYKKSHVQISVE